MPNSLSNLTAEEVLAVASLFPALAAHNGDEQAMIQAGAEVIGAAVGDTCVIRLIDDETGRLGPFAVWSRDSDAADAIGRALSEHDGLPGGSLGSDVVLREQVVMTDVDKATLLSLLPAAFRPFAERLDVISLTITPIAAPGAPLGYIAVTREGPNPPITAHDVDVIDGFVPRLSVMLANARLLSRLRGELEEKERVVAALAKSESRLRTILDHTFDMVSVIGLDGRLLYVSPSVERILGWTPAEITGRPVADYLHTDDARRLAGTAQTVASGGVTTHVEYRARTTDGRWVHLEAAAGGTTTVGGVLGVVVSARDVTDRLIAEQERRLLAGIVQSSEDAVVSVDTAGRVTSWNSAAERMFERSASEVIGQPVELFIDAGSGRLADARRRLEGGELISQVRSFRRPSGDVQLSVTAWPLYDADGTYSGWASISRDITERVEAVRRLEESEQFFRALFDSAPVGVAVLQADGSIVRCNHALEALTCKDPVDLRGCSFLQLVDPADRAATRGAIELAVSRPRPVRIEHRIRAGSDRLVDAESTITAVDGTGQLLVHVHDVSRAKLAERFLLQRASQQACVAQLGAAALTETDLNQLAATAAQLTADTLGFARVELVASEQPPVFRPVTASAGGPLPANSETIEVSIQAPGRAIGTLSVTRPAAPDDIRLFLDAVASMLGAAAERQALEAQLALADRVKDIGALAGSVAHDFNNLLTIVLSAGEMARERVDSDELAADALDKVLDAGTRAAGLVRQLTAWSLEQALDPVSVDISALVKDMEPVLRSLITENVEFSVTCAEPRLFVGVERTNLEQILVNLVVNARDALPSGGRVSIEIEEQRRADRDGVLLVVTDDGPGMDPDVAARCFAPFFTTKSDGTGLGLATVHRIVTMAGGEVDLSTSPGSGTKFVIWLPCEDEAHAVVASSESPPVQGGSGLVLVVEDESHVRELLIRSLTSAGYAVLVAEDGEKAIELARCLDESVDLLVTDVVMPGRSGVTVANELRHLWPELPVLFITGHAPHGSGPPEGGEYAVLRKPFTPSQFVNAVRRELDAARR